MIGGICSLSRLTMVNIFRAVFCNDDPMALTTLVLSVQLSEQLDPSEYQKDSSPSSVLGVASVTSKAHFSQQTSSSAFAVNHPNPPPPFRLFFSKNNTNIFPRTLLLGDEVEFICRTNCPVRVSIRVSSSGSATSGRVKSRTSRLEGRIEGK